MISCYRTGDLGNNLFQMAAAIAYANKYDQELSLPVYYSLIEGETHWFYVNEFMFPLNVFNKPFGLQFKEYLDKGMRYKEIPHIEGNVMLKGLYFSMKYWEHCTDQVRKMFTPSPRIMEEVAKILIPNATAIHVRRGNTPQDKLWEGTGSYKEAFGVQPLEYYQRAMKEFPGPYMVFSDDILWCKENIIADYYSGNGPALDFFTMMSCPRIIMSNSTFSWWAQYLGNSEVIAPKAQRWGNPKVYTPEAFQDLIMEHWKLI